VTSFQQSEFSYIHDKHQVSLANLKKTRTILYGLEKRVSFISTRTAQRNLFENWWFNVK